MGCCRAMLVVPSAEPLPLSFLLSGDFEYFSIVHVEHEDWDKESNFHERRARVCFSRLAAASLDHLGTRYEVRGGYIRAFYALGDRLARLQVNVIHTHGLLREVGVGKKNVA